MLAHATFGEVAEQCLADTASAELGTYEEIFEVDPVSTAEGRKVVEPQGEARSRRRALCRPFGDIGKHPWCGSKECVIQTRGGGVHLIEELLVARKVPDQAEQGGAVAGARWTQGEHGGLRYNCRQFPPAFSHGVSREFDMQIQGKTVIITGGGRGIGRDMAKSFAARGANLALFDLNLADLEESVRQCAALGVTARPYVVNVTQEAAVIAGMDAVVADFGGIDVLVNNAGIVKDGMLIKVKDGTVVGKMTLDQWQAVIDINLTGVFLCGREAAERMIKRGQGGVIINISSVSRAGNAGQTNYTATKAGVASMAVVWAKELARFGIRTGAIAPGFVRTDILSSMRPEILQKFTSQVPLQRLGEASEIAHAALFIVENDFFTGRCVDVDGGIRI